MCEQLAQLAAAKPAAVGGAGVKKVTDEVLYEEYVALYIAVLRTLESGGDEGLAYIHIVSLCVYLSCVQKSCTRSITRPARRQRAGQDALVELTGQNVAQTAQVTAFCLYEIKSKTPRNQGIRFGALIDENKDS